MLQAEVHYEKNESFVDLKTLITPVFSIFHPVWTPHIQSNYHQQRTSQILKISHLWRIFDIPRSIINTTATDRCCWSTEYLSLFSANVGKYEPEKLRIRTLFTQWLSSNFHGTVTLSRLSNVILMFPLFFTRKIIIMSSWRVLEIYDNFLKGYL